MIDWRVSARSSCFGIFFGLWHLGFILPVIRGVNPTLNSWVAALLAVFLVLYRFLKVAAHAAGIDRSVVVSAKHAIAFKLQQERGAFLFRNPRKAGELLPIDAATVDKK
jgi:hypothetical protein